MVTCLLIAAGLGMRFCELILVLRRTDVRIKNVLRGLLSLARGESPGLTFEKPVMCLGELSLTILHSRNKLEVTSDSFLQPLQRLASPPDLYFKTGQSDRKHTPPSAYTSGETSGPTFARSRRSQGHTQSKLAGPPNKGRPIVAASKCSIGGK